MSRANYVYKNARNISPHLKQAVLTEALELGVTMSDVIGTSLAVHYDVPYQWSGERSIGADLAGSQLRIQIPPVIGLRITQEARRTKQTESSVILGVIAARYGLLHEPVRKGRKSRAAA